MACMQLYKVSQYQVWAAHKNFAVLVLSLGGQLPGVGSNYVISSEGASWHPYCLEAGCQSQQKLWDKILSGLAPDTSGSQATLTWRIRRREKLFLSWLRVIYVSPLIVMKIKHSQKYSLGYQTSKFRQNRVAMHNVHNVPVKHHSSAPRPWREGALTMNQTGQSHEPQYKFAFEQLLKKFSQDL